MEEITGSFNSLADAWLYAIRQIHNHGFDFRSEWGSKCRGLNGMLVKISDGKPLTRFGDYGQLKPNGSDPFATPDKLNAYMKEYQRGWLESKKGKEKPEYTYLDRFIDYEGVDELSVLRERLAECPAWSRRCQAITWKPKTDLYAESVPCFQRGWIFPKPNHRIELNIHYRSWDMWRAFESNIIAIADMFDREVFQPNNYQLDTIRCFGDNVHYYADAEEDIVRLLKRGY